MSGSNIGTLLAFTSGGLLCKSVGWSSIFYIFGSIGVVISILWLVFASDLPSENRFIKTKEKEFIKSETSPTKSNSNPVRRTLYSSKKIKYNKRQSHNSVKVPWSEILKSKTCISIFIANIASDWGLFLFLTSLPTYMKEILQFDISLVRFRLHLEFIYFFKLIQLFFQNGLLSGLPYLFFWMFQLASGFFSDRLIRIFSENDKSIAEPKEKEKRARFRVRQIFNGLGFFVPMCAVIGLMFITSKIKILGVVLITIGCAFM